METLNASVILDDAYRLMDWDPDQLEPRQKAMARQALSTALQEIWESWWWEVLMQCRQTQFYVAMDFGNFSFYSNPPTLFLYWPLRDAYYQVLTTADDLPSVNPTQWILARTAEEIAALPYFDPMAPLKAGDMVRFENVTTTDMKGYVALVDNPGDPYVNAANWAEVLAFLPNVSTAAINPAYGSIRSVSRLNPRTTRNCRPYPLTITSEGVVVATSSIGRPWVWYRRPTPVLTGDGYDASANYTATDPAELTFDT